MAGKNGRLCLQTNVQQFHTRGVFYKAGSPHLTSPPTETPLRSQFLSFCLNHTTLCLTLTETVFMVKLHMFILLPYLIAFVYIIHFYIYINYICIFYTILDTHSYKYACMYVTDCISDFIYGALFIQMHVTKSASQIKTTKYPTNPPHPLKKEREGKETIKRQ